MRYLIAETVALKPVLETAGELALTLQSQGHETVFSWLGNALPWSDWHLPWFARFLGCSLEQRERRFENILTNRGIHIESPAPVPEDRLLALRQWAEQFNGDLNALKHYGLEGVNLGMGAASSLISLYGNSAYDPTGNLPQVHKCLITSAIVFERANALIRQIKPDAVITFNGRFATARPILAAAQAAKVQLLRHERGATFERYEVYTDALHNFAYIRDRIAAAWQQADPVERERLGHDFFRRRRGGDGIGWYSYTADQEQGRIPPKIPGKRRVVYFSSSDDEYAAVTDVFEPGPWPDQFSAVQDLLKAVALQPDIELVMRLHPHLDKKASALRARWLALAQPGVRLIPPEEKIDSYALLDSADIVVSYGSTIGLEAAYWGKPTVLIGPGHYTGSPAVVEPKTLQELSLYLHPSHIPAVPDKIHCLPCGHYYLTYGTKFQYYKPLSLSEGMFLGERLGWDPDIVYWLRQKKSIKKLSRTLLRRK